MGGDWEPLFDELTELEEPARSGRLDEIRAANPGLGALLERLLAADASQRTLAEPVLRREPDFVSRALESERSVGPTVGPYRLLGLLGEGGMGEVYRAERCDGEFEQQVALKRIRLAASSGAIHERFVRERQILARLDHPGIARLLDGGRDADGRPYFVLELIDGEPITAWCTSSALPIPERLRLMAEVADAVHAAHQQLVVHRDLKPSNILVDRGGRPRLLDFGIATILATEGDAALTQHQHGPFTPSYAAPEQILGEPISTATDVWALGALLFELLTDRLPFPSRGRHPGELVRTMSHELAERPSSVVAAADDAQLRQRSRLLAGDLDAITLTALARDPGRRYRSAADFAEDLRRHLDRLPVRARAPSVAYRARKLIARHRVAVSAACLVALSLVSGLALALWQARVARLEARRAETVTGLLIDLFQASDPSMSLGADVTARDLLAVGAGRVEGALADQPAIRGRVLDAIAQVERRLGLSELAEAHARSALEALAGDSAAVAATRVTLAEVLNDRGAVEQADAELDQAAALAPHLRRLTSARGEEIPLSRRWIDTSIGSAWQQFDLPRVETLLDASIAELRAQPDADPFELARRQLDLAALLIDASRAAEAGPVLREAMPAIETASGDPVAIGDATYQVGEILGVLGEHQESRTWLMTGLSRLSAVLGADHPEIALREISFGYLLHERRELDEADRVLRHAISVLEPRDHPETGAAIRYLGFVDMSRGDPVQGLERFVDAEHHFDRYPEQQYLAISCRLSQGWALLEMGDPAAAEARLRPVLVEFEALEGTSGNSVRTALKYLGQARRELGDATEALALHQRALSIERELFGRDEHLGVASTKYQIALDLLALGRLEEARSSIDDAIATLRELDPEAPRLADFLAASDRIAAAEAAQGSLRNII